VHLTVGGCLGPCALANVNLLLFDGRALWLHSLNSRELVTGLFDWIERMLEADGFVEPGWPLEAHLFTASTWQGRQDGQELDDGRHWRGRELRPDATPTCEVEAAEMGTSCVGLPRPTADGPDESLAAFDDAVAAPRRNGELVFEEPWQGRAFGMVAAQVESGLFSWDQFRERLIVAIREAEAEPGPFEYYRCWLQAFEGMIEAVGVAGAVDIEERTAEFEFGERFDIY
jgi:nitrile hydratase accessory protein